MYKRTIYVESFFEDDLISNYKYAALKNTKIYVDMRTEKVVLDI